VKTKLAKFLMLVLTGGMALALGVWFKASQDSMGDKGRDLEDVKRRNAIFQGYLSKPLPLLGAEKVSAIDQHLGPRFTVVNLWATWCTPCREEMPEFEAFRREHGQARGLAFVGIAIDRTEPVSKFIKDIGVGYPILFDGIDGIEATRAFGNEKLALPFSFILDANGRVIQTKLGKLTRDDLLLISRN
jgi:thiol-disulfide isomerase/thioredoxin